MAISRTIDRTTNFLRLLIITTYNIPITISLVFNVLNDFSYDELCFNIDRNSSLVTTDTLLEFYTNWDKKCDLIDQRDKLFEDVEDWDYSLSAPIPYVNILVITVVLIWAMFRIYTYVCTKKRQSDEEDQIADQVMTETFESCSPRPFTFEELSQETSNFSQDMILGMGGFGAVYRAILPSGKIVAVKRVSNTSQQGVREYKAEVTIISRSNHRNLVQLIGWCHEREGELLVVYELMENKSLDVYLFNSQIVPLAWDVRYKIAQGLATALCYVHEECGQRCVLHMDIKSSNVLLDFNFEPKLSDFGLARLVDHDRSMEVSVLAGTRGYLAPECVLSGKVSKQSDVYSYGVVALELATGRKTIDLDAEEDQKVLVKWVQG